MAQKKNPNRRTTPTKITTADEWLAGTENAGMQPLPLPSGKTCLVQPLGIPELLKRGLIPNPLVAIIMDALDIQDAGLTATTPASKAKAERKQQEKLRESMQQLIDSPEKMGTFFEMVDNIVVACVVEPPVSHPPADPNDRKQGVLYVDIVDLDDRMYIMSNAMSGVRDLEPFREAVGSSVGDDAGGDGS